jgi:hypothetical protein
MKKIIYLLALVLIPIFLIAQEKDNAELKRLVFSNYSVAQASDFTSTTTYNVLSTKATVEGSIFLNEEWSDVEIFGNKGQSFTTKGKYNIHADELQFLDAKKAIRGISAAKIKGFMLDGKVFLSKQDENLTYNFYQVLSYGKLGLLLKYKTTLVTTNDNPVLGSANGDKKIMISNKLYYADVKGIYKLPKGNKKVLAIMSDKKTAMKKAVEEGNLNLRKQADLVAAFDIYNRIRTESEAVD